MAPTREELVYATNHIFLPPKLPQSDDSGNETALFAITIDALTAFKQIVSGPTAQDATERARLTLAASKAAHTSEGLSETALRQALTNLKSSLSLHVKKQNAGLIITKIGSKTNFEQFELSPQNASVFASAGRLVRTFPASAISISNDDLSPEAVAMIAQTLSTLSTQAAPGMQPQSSKSGQTHDEFRDTTHPGMISEYFMSLLLPLGAFVSVSAVTKRTREEVHWSNAKLPFRRSPLWLLIRVTLQLIFSRVTLSTDMYKLFVTFLMSHILKLSLEGSAMSVQSETIYFMEATIARRLLKLPEEVSDRQRAIVESINAILLVSTDYLTRRWQTIQANQSQRLDLSALGTLHFEQDAHVNMPQLDTYLRSLQQRQTALVSEGYSPSARLVNYSADQLPDLSQSSTGGTYLTAKLEAFEQWVSDHLEAWLEKHDQDASTCGRLADMLCAYHVQASGHYANNPEAFSILILTTLDIWVSCDKAAIAACPLLSEYDAGIPFYLLQSLLLPTRAQMTRLHAIEVYLHSRCGSAGLQRTSLLYDTSSPESFGAKYYDTSPDHQEIHAEIDQWARETRAQKIAELNALQAEYRRLSRIIERTACQTERVFNSYTEEYDEKCLATCRRCACRRQLEALTISSHEWPLPRDLNTAKVVTFELRVPQWYARWRDGTRFLLRQVLCGQKNGEHPRASYPLSSDRHLASKYYVSPHDTPAIGLLSQDKPFAVTHWRSSQAGTVQEKDVCVDNGLNYQYFDSSSNTFGHAFTFGNEVSNMSTYQLPSSYRGLQKFLVRSSGMPDGPPPNEVIAGQAGCRFDMPLQEFKELASLPLGHRIQWDNILLQLNAPSVDFKKSETTLFVLQCIFQAGPWNETVLRAAHHTLAETGMAEQIIELLNKALDRVKENWESSQAISVFITIAVRVWDLNNDASLYDACLAFLLKARKVLFGWVQLLRNKSHNALDTNTRTLFSIKSVEFALLCAASFDVSEDHLIAILTPTDSASMLIQCSIILHDSWVSLNAKCGGLDQLLYFRCKRMLHRCHDLLVQHTSALDHAMRQAWSAYVPGTQWTSVSDECPEWVTCMTADVPGIHALQVHYNTLTGELLVRGTPLNTPPQQYVQQAMYTTLFSNHLVEVMPSMIPGMQFSTKKSFNGYTVHMGLKNAELLVQASDGASTFETVPSRILQGIFPLHFEQDYIHWYDFATGSIQFRAKSKPWDATSNTIWTLHKHGSGWRLQRAGHTVVFLHSRTSSVIAGYLKSLSVATGIHITTNSSSSDIDIQIPALRLDFLISENDWHICSKQYRGMRIDEDQSLETLHGLENRLLLKDETGHRQLLLPEAEQISCQPTGLHVTVSLDTNAIRKLHLFDIDNFLGRLSDDGSVHAKLFIAFLHALTSFCLPDHFTSMTGTEQALSILRSAGVASFDQLSKHDISVLVNIAGLTPFREFYPQHLRQMQTTDWDPRLSWHSQHAEFVDVVAKLLNQHSATTILYPDTEKPNVPRLKLPDKILRDRDLIRSSTVRTAGFGAEHHTDVHDVVYASRDRDQNSQRAKNVFHLSNLIYHKLSIRRWRLSAGYLWQSMESCQAILPPNQQALGIKKLKYDVSLMLTKEQTGQNSMVQTNWPSLHRLVAHHMGDDRRRYALMAFVTTMGWSSSTDVLVLQCLCLIFTTPALADVVFPAAVTTSLSPVRGRQPTQSELTSMIKSHVRPIDQCLENSLPQNPGESRRNWKLRVTGLYQSNMSSAVNTFVQSLLNQWPVITPVIPPRNSQTIRRYVSVDPAMPSIVEYFRACYDNMLFYDYLSSLEAQVASLAFGSAHDLACINLNALPPSVSTTTHVTIGKLFLDPDEQLMQRYVAPALDIFHDATTGRASADNHFRLSNVVAKLDSIEQRPSFETNYIAELQDSIECLRSYDGDQIAKVVVTLAEAVEYRESCRQHVDAVYEDLVAATTSGLSDLTQASSDVQQWPRVSPLFFLQQLSHGTLQGLSPQWKTRIIQYGLAITALQRATRIARLAENGTSAELTQELQNAGHGNWQPEDFPSSLLMEIENGFLIRPVQEQVAAVMRQPSGTSVNATVQLNMGAGKSSVVVPIVAAALADGSKLVRVVVAKPQSKQMAQMLLSKLGGMLNRRVYYLPISRAIKLDIGGAAYVGKMLRECMSGGGILLVQPEHILSLKLMGVESFITDRTELGLTLAITQDFLDNSARDIVDESDENFSPRFELCYTMSAQRQMELCPERWVLIQQVFDLVEICAPLVAIAFPDSIMISKGALVNFRECAFYGLTLPHDSQG